MTIDADTLAQLREWRTTAASNRQHMRQGSPQWIDADVIVRLCDLAESAEDRATRAEQQVARVADLRDSWQANRTRNGRPMLSTANVVERITAALDGQEGDE